MSEDGSDVPVIGEIRRLRLEPGDALVIRFPSSRVTMADAQVVKERVRAAVGDWPVIVLAGGAEVEILSQPEPPQDPPHPPERPPAPEPPRPPEQPVHMPQVP